MFYTFRQWSNSVEIVCANMKRVCGLPHHKLRIITSHRSIAVHDYCVHAAYCYRPSSVSVFLSIGLSVCQSVTLVSPAKTAEAIEMPFGLRTLVSPRTHVLHGQFWGGNARTIVKYRDTLWSSVQKRLNGWRYRLGYGLAWAKESFVRWWSRSPPMERGNYGG